MSRFVQFLAYLLLTTIYTYIKKNNMKIKFVFLVSLFLIHINLNGQVDNVQEISKDIAFFDCISKEPYCGNNKVNLETHTCGRLQSKFLPKSSKILYWKSSDDSNLEFTLSSKHNDIDFIFFEVVDGEYVPLRIMYSGEVKGNKNESIRCQGDTGLRIGESDISEDLGCSDSDNNFLKPVQLFKGKDYALLIFSFEELDQVDMESNIKHIDNSNYNTTFYIQNNHLKCEEIKNHTSFGSLNWNILDYQSSEYPLSNAEVITGLTDNTPIYLQATTLNDCLVTFEGFIMSTDSDIELYPNPAKEKIYLKNHKASFADVEFNIYNSKNQLVSKEKYSSLLNMSIIEIDVEGLNSGSYFLRLKNGNTIKVLTFVKL